MTFGSILAATDPVAVSALLNELGAPPRLKVRVMSFQQTKLKLMADLNSAAFVPPFFFVDAREWRKSFERRIRSRILPHLQQKILF